ncbi:MAG TPA: glycosyltransferase family 39 protein [Vicinamibacterales bacterium]|jgi:hypothetical protein|nr:glycosyltransferase family 39 protein [Vicinamibacterales bacterium]
MPVDAARTRGGTAWTSVAVAWFASLAAIVVWLSTTSPAMLREQLAVLQPWWLDGTVLIAVLISVCAIARVNWLSVRRHAMTVFPLVALGLCLTLFVAPRTSRIFYDEQIYQSIGQNISDVRRAQVCNDGTVDSGRLHCVDGGYNKQPYAYPHLLSLAYRIAGVHEWAAFAVNAVAMACSIVGVYSLAWLLFGDRATAFFAGLVLALIPQQIVWSATAAVEPTASLGAILAVLAAAWYFADGSLLALASLVTVSAYAIQFRPESLLVLPVAAAMAWPRLRGDLARPRGWWGAVCFVALIAVHLAHLFAVRDVGWGSDGPRFSLAFVSNNLQANGRFFLGDERFPVLFTVLAVAGLAGASRIRERWLMVVWFLLFFGVDLAFYAGSFNYGADVRYSLMTYAPLAVLAGAGASAIARSAGRRFASSAAVPVVAAVLLFQFLWYAPSVRAVNDTAWAARADVAFAKDFAARLPVNAYVLTQNPGMFQVWGVSAGQMSRAVTSPNYTSWLLAQHPGGVYVHWNFWCNVQEPAQPDLCRRALALGQATPIAEWHERDQRFAFYRLAPATVNP